MPDIPIHWNFQHICFYLFIFYLFFVVVVQLQLSAFSPHPSTPPQPEYFIYYAVTVVLIFPPLPHLHPNPHSHRPSPHHCLCPWVMHVSSLATPFPILYFTSPCLFCNYLCVLLNALTSSPIPPHHPPIWQPSKCFQASLP